MADGILIPNLHKALLVARHVWRTDRKLKSKTKKFKNFDRQYMPQNLDLETKVILKFIDKAKQNRYIQFISTPKNRRKFICELAHFNDFKLDLFQKINKTEDEAILSTLHKNKIPDKNCYVLSENIELDTKILDTSKAIQATIGYGMGTILVFGDAEIIFYESESMNTRYISKLIK